MKTLFVENSLESHILFADLPFYFFALLDLFVTLRDMFGRIILKFITKTLGSLEPKLVHGSRGFQWLVVQ